MKQSNMKPQDLLILFKIISNGSSSWQQKPLAESLCMSQSEISQSLKRSEYAGLINLKTKIIMRLALMEFLQYGFCYVFPQKPGAVVRGIETAHSIEPLKSKIISEEIYVWPYPKGKIKGHGITPIFPSAIEASIKDEKLHKILALTDVLRIGRAREKEMAIFELKKIILDAE